MHLRAYVENNIVHLQRAQTYRDDIIIDGIELEVVREALRSGKLSNGDYPLTL